MVNPSTASCRRKPAIIGEVLTLAEERTGERIAKDDSGRLILKTFLAKVDEGCFEDKENLLILNRNLSSLPGPATCRLGSTVASP
jgi:hypothetical protein